MPESTSCPNCLKPLEGQFCYQCGQNQKGIDRFFFTLINEAFEDIFSVKSRAWKTLFALLLKPGFLTREYFAGRRARYVQPIRLYLVSSIVFFALFSLANFLSDEERFKLDDPQQQVAQPVDSAAINDGETLDIPTDMATDSLTEQAVDNTTTGGSKIITRTPGGAVITIPDVNQDGDTVEPVELDFGDGDFEVPFLDEEQQQRLKRILERQVKKAKDDPGELKGNLIELIPPILFVLVPLFALLLKIMYLFSRRYYTEHLILAVHNHCFLFVMLTFNLIAENSVTAWPAIFIPLETVLLGWIPIYMWLSLKRVYQQGFWLTSFKFIVLGISYSALLGVSIMLALLVGLMTI